MGSIFKIYPKYDCFSQLAPFHPVQSHSISWQGLCSSFLLYHSASTLVPLESIFYPAARVITSKCKLDHITSLFKLSNGFPSLLESSLIFLPYIQCPTYLSISSPTSLSFPPLLLHWPSHCSSSIPSSFPSQYFRPYSCLYLHSSPGPSYCLLCYFILISAYHLLWVAFHWPAHYLPFLHYWFVFFLILITNKQHTTFICLVVCCV